LKLDGSVQSHLERTEVAASLKPGELLLYAFLQNRKSEVYGAGERSISQPILLVEKGYSHDVEKNRSVYVARDFGRQFRNSHRQRKERLYYICWSIRG
jgi:hypothetical protein